MTEFNGARLAGVEIIAHRGSSHDAPENTLAAARLAWKEGADAIELDVQLTADGKLAVLHDENTKRVAGMALAVGKTSMAELARLDVGRWKDARYAGEKISVLDEMLAVVPVRKRVFVEIKSGPEAVVELKRTLGRCQVEPQQVVVISFDYAVVAAAKKLLPRHAAAWILDYDLDTRRRFFDEIIGRCRDTGLDALDLSAGWPIDTSFVSQVHGAGLKLYVWTVDDPGVARRLADARVDGIATNRPGWLRAQLRK